MTKKQKLLYTALIIVSLLVPSIYSMNNHNNSFSNHLLFNSNSANSIVLDANPKNVTQLKTFFDNFIDQQITNHNIPGATLSVVNSTQVLHHQGYGYSNIEQSSLVNSTSTMFRAASVSKLFTWTAAMQLYEQGLLDLNEDINTYLTNFSIPEKFDEPITMLHLMSHTAGFDQPNYRRNIPWTVEELPTLEEALIKYMPSRIWKPGFIPVYSNYGAGLAGYTISAISGLPFEEYIEQNIFEPLGMNFSTFQQPIPDGYLEDVVTGYYLNNENELVAQPFEYRPFAPAGTISISALDMAQFMMAHLDNGRNILNVTTTQFMHQQHFTKDSRVAGIAHGFLETYVNGYRIIKHGGNLAFTQSHCILLPSENIGYFINYNANHHPLRDELLSSFMNTFFPGPTFTHLSPTLNFKETGKKFEGRYYQTRSDYTTASKSAHMMEYQNIFIDSEGYLIIYGQKMVQIDGMLFCAFNYNYTILFIENARGKITHFVYGYEPVFSMEKQTIINSMEFSISYISFCLLALLGSVIYLRVDKWKRKKKNENTSQNSVEKVASVLSIGLVSMYILDFFIFLPLLLISSNTDVLLETINILTIVPIILFIITIVFLIHVGYLWISKKSSTRTKLVYVSQLLLIGMFLWFLINWNWIGFPF